LHTLITKKYISTKMILDNYDGLANPREHVQNVRNNLELVIQDIDSMCKILPKSFNVSAWAWYKNLESSSITCFRDLNAKLVSYLGLVYKSIGVS
jgi:hypothetical protein